MKVWFVGAGPGDPDLLTVRAARLIATCPVVIFTGSLVPRAIVESARPDARVIDSASLDLDAIIGIMKEAAERGEDVARVHTGDPMIYGSTAEQMRRLDELGIAYSVVPGISAFSAAAAALKQELTLPEIAQTIIISRAAGRTPVPESESLSHLARHRATLALYLSAGQVHEVVETLVPHYGADCPAAVVHRASWPDERIIRAALGEIAGLVKDAGISSHAVILVGRFLSEKNFKDSRLYAAEFTHGFREGTKDE